MERRKNMFEGLESFLSMISVILSSFPGEVMGWLYTIFGFVLIVAVGKYVLDSL